MFFRAGNMTKYVSIVQRFTENERVLRVELYLGINYKSKILKIILSKKIINNVSRSGIPISMNAGYWDSSTVLVQLHDTLIFILIIISYPLLDWTSRSNYSLKLGKYFFHGFLYLVQADITTKLQNHVPGIFSILIILHFISIFRLL